ncbi:hypothetical protein [Ancylomarina euxinus]|nr:hypothetical protein [Ancylomarina euxinus]MCZ4696050.1 hypothetical protein [Ancylomarina euxinus]MUP13989.1 hypothetical protein [Ancylomarina euxinus]
MKKILFIALIASLCFSCGEGEQVELSLKTKEISLYPNERVQISAISGYNMVFRSANDYQATVSVNGLVRAGKVGETFIELTSNDRVVEIPVEVKGRFNLYPDPILDWGMTRSDLIEIAGESDNSSSNSVVEYLDYSDQATRLVYLFDANDVLMCTLVDVLATYSNDLFSYINERYVFNSEDEDLSIFMNAHKEENATLLIGVFNFGGDYIMVMYIENQNAQTKSSHPVSLDIQNIRKRLKSLDSIKRN